MASKRKSKVNSATECFYVLEKLEKVVSSISEVEALIGNSSEYTMFVRKEDATAYLINVMRQRISSELKS
ncbi:MAG: hypothetical protein ACRCZJ_07410 [Erysipelotrichaceae bacterium]